MKSFNYHAPKDVKDATKLASSSSAFLAGGMTLKISRSYLALK